MKSTITKVIIFSLAQIPVNFTISNMEVELISSDEKILISCRVSHPLGLNYIKKVAATIYHGKFVTCYLTLYDDGTHGDKVANDGIYS